MSSIVVALVIASILLLIIGIFGNALAIYNFSTTKELKKHSTTVYFICVCILNIIISLCLPYEMLPFITEITTINCKIYLALVVTVPKIKAWILVFTSLERLKSVLAPRRFNFINKLKFQLVAILLTLVVAVLLSVPYVFFSQLLIISKIKQYVQL